MPRPVRRVPWLVWRQGVAYATWYDEVERRTKRQSLHTTDAGEAQKRFAEFLVSGAKPKLGGLTVADALEQYRVEHVKKHCADGRRQEDAMVHLRAFFGDAILSDIDIPASRRYAEARRSGAVGVESRRSGKSRKASDGTIRRELTVLIAAANHARKWKRLSTMPSIERPAEKLLGVDDEAPHFTRSEIQMMIDLAEDNLRDFIVLAYYTGARRASIEELTLAQVKWDRDQVILQKPGKMATKKRQPIVSIHPKMRSTLERLCYRAATEERQRLFTSDFYRPFRQLCESLGFGERSHPHLLRHSRATHLLQDGVSLYSVARLLGDTVATVERVYGHHSHAKLAEEIGEK